LCAAVREKADRKITSKFAISKIQKAYCELQRGLFLMNSEARKQKNSREIHPLGLANEMNLRLQEV
jgi:hypothetical protein